MLVFLQSDCVKQKKQVLKPKQTEIFKQTDAVALRHVQRGIQKWLLEQRIKFATIAQPSLKKEIFYFYLFLVVVVVVNIIII